MGMIAVIDRNVDLDDYFARLSEILKKVDPDAKPSHDPTMAEDLMPPAKSAAGGSIELAEFPNQNPNEPGLMVFAWPPDRNLSSDDEYLLDLFLDNVAGGTTSNL